MEIFVVIGIIILFVLLAINSFFRSRPKKPVQVIKELKANNAKKIFTDNGKKNFNSTKYKISARPDFIYEEPDGSKIIVEYKSRNNPVRESDIIQLIATAIAVKESHPTVCKGFIYTQGNHIEIVDLSKSIDELANSISNEIIKMRAIKMRVRPSFEPIESHCFACGFRDACDSRLC